MQLHAYMHTAGGLLLLASCFLLLACASCFWLLTFGAQGKGMGATRILSRTHGSAWQPQQRRQRCAALRKMARVRGRAPGAEQKQAASSGERRGFA
jgi:hypothetical protein